MKKFIILSIVSILSFSCGSDDSSIEEAEKELEKLEEQITGITGTTESEIEKNPEATLSSADCLKLAQDITDFTPRIAELTNEECIRSKQIINNYLNGGCTVGKSEIEKVLALLGDCK